MTLSRETSGSPGGWTSMIFLYLTLVSELAAECVQFDTCHSVRKGPDQLRMPCSTNVSARPLPAEPHRTLAKMCPHLFADGNSDVCCSSSQVDSLVAQMSMPSQILRRCNSCYDNFVKLWCDFSCSPDQSNFVQVLKTNRSTLTNKHYVDTVSYRLNADFANGMFDSCKNVKFYGEKPALSVMCGRGPGCTLNKWLKFMGTQDHSLGIPYNINFEIEEANGNSSRVSSTTHTSCFRRARFGLAACSCEDCEQSCKTTLNLNWDNPHHEECFLFPLGCSSLVVFASLTLLLSTSTIAVVANYAFATEVTDANDYKGMETRMTIMEQLGEWVEHQLEINCELYGQFCARHPLLVLTFGLTCALVCSLGMFHVRFTTDPVELWSSSGSRARVEKKFFDENFGPFYRTEQVIMFPTPRPSNAAARNFTHEERVLGPVFRKQFLRHIFELVSGIQYLSVMVDDKRTTLDDVCLKPMGLNGKCVVLSPSNYFQNDLNKLHSVHTEIPIATTKSEKDDVFDDDDVFDYDDQEKGLTVPHTSPPRTFTYVDHLIECIQNQMSVKTSLGLSCLGDFGGPVGPNVVFGDYQGTNNPELATGVVITIPLVGTKNVSRAAQAWESQFIGYMKNISHDNYTISFMAERSIEDEIERESESDAFTILISYMFMFGYVAFALGQYHVTNDNLRSLLVHSKILLGVAGVLIVALSVTSSIGVYAMYGIPATMICLEVQPFLVLAVGVDNIFIFVQAYQRSNASPDEPLETRIGRISSEVIPSTLLSSLAECLCFFLGALSDMPAVRVFSLYAALALFFDFFLQITCFLSLFVLDIRREEAGRPEIFCCEVLETDRADSEGYMLIVFRKYYAPFLLNTWIRLTVMFGFISWLCISIFIIRRLKLGLDQKMAVPEDSYVYRHFNNMNRYLSVGPPVYFVIKGEINYANVAVQNAFCSLGGCDSDSVSALIGAAARESYSTFIASPAINWLDDFLEWSEPFGNPPCCRLYPNGTFCSAMDTSPNCTACSIDSKNGRPSPSSFKKHLPMFLSDNPTDKCAKGGSAAYSNALVIGNHGVSATHFMTYHTVLRTSEDFIKAMSAARHIGDILRDTLVKSAAGNNIEVFPYSVFYVFYEQYSTIVRDASTQLALSLAAIFCVTTVLLGLDPWSSGLIVFTITCILVDLLGLMYFWNIEFNAISVVNLVMAVGISVEFCVHMVRSFSHSVQRSRIDRAREALALMGSSVLSGITMTKFGGILVLAFAHSQIFKVFYFRMFLGIVLIGGAHGLIFLPVILTYVGPPVSRRLLAQRVRDMNCCMLDCRSPNCPDKSCLHEAVTSISTR